MNDTLQKMKEYAELILEYVARCEFQEVGYRVLKPRNRRGRKL